MPHPIHSVITELARRTECRHCDATVTVPEAECFEHDGQIVFDKRSALCPKHQASYDAIGEKAAHYSGDVPPSWFDASYAGEEW